MRAVDVAGSLAVGGRSVEQSSHIRQVSLATGKGSD